jgi:transcriptional regulator with XRE-family HTH domain
MGASAEERLKRRFGDRLRQLRKQARLSQEQLALQSELDRSYIGRVERGKHNISLVNIHRIAEALGIRPGGLLE